MKFEILTFGLILSLAALTACDVEPREPVLPGELPSRNYGGPVWGPNNVILFRHTPANIDSSGLWQIHADGTDQRFFLPTYFDLPDWSSDGKWLAVNKDAQIYKMTVTKDSVLQLTTGALRKFHPSWSPDGKWIAFHINDGAYSDWGIWAVSADGNEKRQIKQIAGLNPDWSPDGDKICFVGWPGDARKSKLLIMNTLGSNLGIVFDPSKHGFQDTNDINHPSFSPDGWKIVFQVDSAENRDAQIWVVNVDGSKPKRLTSKGGLEPSWGPDGQRIVYTRFSYRNTDQKGNGKLWVMDANGKNKRQLTF
ncbi:MAG: TolB family protein [bacterium]